MSPLARASILLLALPALALPAAAQRDRIVLKDGTVFEEAAVRTFNLRNLEFRVAGRADQRDSDRVAYLDVSRVREAYRRGYADANSESGPATFVGIARGQDDAFLKQFGYYEASRISLRRADYASAFAALEELEKECPDSGFIPELYRAKCEYYLSKGKGGAKDAQSVAKRYEQNSLTKGYPSGCQVEAKYYVLRAQAVAGDLDAQRLETQMSALAGSASSVPYVSDRARLAVADAKRAQGERDDAKGLYQDLLGKDRSSEVVRAGAWLGIGYCLFESAGSDTEVHRQALLAFLRVYLETLDASPDMTAEALYMAAQAAKKWGGSSRPGWPARCWDASSVATRTAVGRSAERRRVGRARDRVPSSVMSTQGNGRSGANGGSSCAAESRAALAHHLSYDLVRRAVRPLLRLVLNVRVEGRRPLDGAHVLVANHASFLDPIVLGSLAPRPVTFMMTQLHFRSAVLGWFYRWSRAIPLAVRGMGNRGGAACRSRSAAARRVAGDLPRRRPDPRRRAVPGQSG